MGDGRRLAGCQRRVRGLRRPVWLRPRAPGAGPRCGASGPRTGGHCPKVGGRAPSVPSTARRRAGRAWARGSTPPPAGSRSTRRGSWALFLATWPPRGLSRGLPREIGPALQRSVLALGRSGSRSAAFPRSRPSALPPPGGLRPRRRAGRFRGPLRSRAWRCWRSPPGTTPGGRDRLPSGPDGGQKGRRGRAVGKERREQPHGPPVRDRHRPRLEQLIPLGRGETRQVEHDCGERAGHGRLPAAVRGRIDISARASSVSGQSRGAAYSSAANASRCLRR